MVVAFEISKSWVGDPHLEKTNSNLLKLYDDCCFKDDYMGLVANTARGEYNVPICVQVENEGLQRTSLDLATSSTSDLALPSFPYAVQMLVDSGATLECDTFIVLVTDGSPWDLSVDAQVKAQIERMNRDRATLVHVLIVGMGLESEQVKEACQRMCTVTKKSTYIDMDATNLDAAFDEVSAVIRGVDIRKGCSLGLTMEKF